MSEYRLAIYILIAFALLVANLVVGILNLVVGS